MALTRAQLLAGNQNLGVVLPGQVQAVSQGLGVLIDTDGTISVDASTAEGLVRLNNSNAYNGYIWPNTIGQADQFLQLVDASGQLRWADASGFAVVVVSPTQPSSPDEGELWYNCNTGSLLVYQNCVSPGGWTNVAQPGLEVTPTNTSAFPPFTNQGTPNAGTLANPYDCTVTTTTPGTSIFIVNEVTVTGLAPYQYVPIVDMNAVTNGGRFHFSNNYANAAGVLVFETIFIDLPQSASGISYTAAIRVGYASAYIDAVVNVVGPLSLTTPGTIAGTPAVGATLTYTRGTATGGVPPLNYTWAWKNNLGNVLKTGTGSGPDTYLVPAAQAGNTIFVELTVTDSATPQSVVTGNAPAVGPITTISIASPGTVTGTAAVGGTLTYNTGTATGGVAPYNYTWVWKNNSGNTLQTGGATYNVPSTQVGKTIFVELVATDSGSPVNTATGNTAPTAAITTLAISNVGSITGNATVGGQLTYSGGVATNGVPPYNYTWLWKDSGGATLQTGGNTYNVTSSEVGKTIFVALTATDSGLPTPQSVTANTSPTAVVTTLAISNPGTISGTAATGATLTYTRGSATGGVPPINYSWIWKNDLGATLATGSGAGPQTYVIPAGQAGRTIYVELTAQDSASPANSVSLNTASTATITGTPITNVQFPTTIPGTANFTWADGNGATLTASSCIEFSVNGNPFTTSATVNNTDTITTQWIDSPACGQAAQGTTISGTLTSGGLVSNGSITINRLPTSVTLNPTTRTANVGVVITPVNFSTTGANTAPLIWGILSAGSTPEYSIDGGGNWIALPGSPAAADILPIGTTALVRYTTGSTGGTETLELRAGYSNTGGQFQSATLTTTVSLAPFPGPVWNPTPSNGLDTIPGLISGLYNGTSNTITPSGCVEVSKDNINWVSAPSTLSITPGGVDTLYSRWSVSALCGGAASDTNITGSVSDGTYENNYAVTVQRQPSSFSYTPVNNAPLNTVQASGTANITNINTTAYVTYGPGTSVGITGTLEARIAGGAWQPIPAAGAFGTGLQIQNNQTLEVRFATGTSPSAVNTAVIYVGDGNTSKFTQASFVVTNTSSAAFPGLSFSPAAGPTASPANTNLTTPGLYGTVTATWPTLPIDPISVTSTGDLEFRNVTTAGSFGQGAQTFTAGDIIAIRWNATAALNALNNATLTGNLTGSGYVTTINLTVDKVPAAYDWGNKTGEGTTSVVVSSQVDISGINAPVRLTYTPDPTNALTSVEALIDNGTWTAIPQSPATGLLINPADTAGTVANPILIRGTTGGANSTTYSITTQIGDGTNFTSQQWDVTTSNVPNVIQTPNITAPTGTNNNPNAFSPAGLTVTGSAYTIVSGTPGAQTDSDWQVVANVGSTIRNIETSVITGVSSTIYSSGLTATCNGSPTTVSNPTVAFSGTYPTPGNTIPAGTYTEAVTCGVSSFAIINCTFSTPLTGVTSFRVLGYGGDSVGTNAWASVNGGGFVPGPQTPNPGIAYWYDFGSVGTVSSFAVRTQQLNAFATVCPLFAVEVNGVILTDVPVILTLTDATDLTNMVVGDNIVQNSPYTPTTSAIATVNTSPNYTAGLTASGGPSGLGPFGGTDPCTNWINTASNGQTITWTSASSAPISGTTIKLIGRGCSGPSDTTETWVVNGVTIATGITPAGGVTVPSAQIPITSFSVTATAANTYFCGANVDGVRLIANQTQLTLTDNTDLSYFAAGNSVTEVGSSTDASGTIGSINPAGPTITLSSSSGSWTTGAQVQGPALSGSGTIASINSGSAPYTISLSSSTGTWVPNKGKYAIDTTRQLITPNQPLESTNQITGTAAASANWAAQTTGFSTDALFTVSYGNGVWIAAGSTGGGTGSQLGYSSSGTSWTIASPPFSTGPVYGSAYANGLFVIVGQGGQLATSSNGSSWNLQTSSFGASPIFDVTYGNGLWVAVGGSGKIATSSNGTSWNQQANSFSALSNIRGVTYGNGLFVAVSDTNEIATSPNGIAWTSRTSSFGAGTSIQGAGYGNGLFLIGASGGQIASSTDGITWTSVTNTFGTSAVYSLTYANGEWVATANNGKLGTSPDGSTWTQQTVGVGTNPVREAAYGNGLWVAVGDGGKVTSATLPSSGTSLTISGANTDGFAVGNLISNGVTGASAASGTITSINSTTVTVIPQSANWANGQNLYRGQTIVNVLGDTSNFTSYFIAKALLATSTTYYARTRYHSATTDSNWSNWSSFGTAATWPFSPGAQTGGGYYAGQINDGGTIYNLIVAPMKGDTTGPNPSGTLFGQYGGTSPLNIQWKNVNTGETGGDATLAQNATYGKPWTDQAGTTGNYAAGTYPLFQWCKGDATGPNGGGGIGGFTDWYIPAKNELAVLYFFLKPTGTSNDTSSGSNPNSVSPYTPNTNYGSGFPGITSSALFAGGAQAMTTAFDYWASTEGAPTAAAWSQIFSNGAQNTSQAKSSNAYARAIRRVQA